MNQRYNENGSPLGWGRKSSSNAGFTLIEVMVATVLLLVILGGGFGALVQGHRLVEAARDETRASQILQSELEDIRTYDWATLTALNATASYSPQESFTDAYSTRYAIRRNISTRSATQRRIRLQVDWTDNGGSSHMREFVTLISKDGLYDYYYRSF